MRVAEARPVSTTIGKGNPFFSKGKEKSFFKTGKEDSFFVHSHGPGIQKKGTQESIIQRQESPDEPETKDPKQPITSQPLRRPPRFTKCNLNPEFPDFGCFAGQLKLDVDDNLRNNAHQFYSVATLHPGDKELMWNTFMRYGLGVNLLQTSFRFLGADKKWSNVLSYGTGLAMKSYQFLQSGELKLDIPIPLGNGVNLDIKFDLNVDPNNMRDVRGVNTSVGISGRF